MTLLNSTVLLGYLLACAAWAAVSTAEAAPGAVVTVITGTGPEPTSGVFVRDSLGQAQPAQMGPVGGGVVAGGAVVTRPVPATKAAPRRRWMERWRPAFDMVKRLLLDGARAAAGNRFYRSTAVAGRGKPSDIYPHSEWYCEDTNATVGIPEHADCEAVCNSIWNTRDTQRQLPKSGWITWQVRSCYFTLSNLNFCHDYAVYDYGMFIGCRNLTSTCNNSFNRNGYIRFPENNTRVKITGFMQKVKDWPDTC